MPDYEMLIGSDPPLVTLFERKITDPYGVLPSTPGLLAFGHADTNSRPGYPAGVGNPARHDAFDTLLADVAGVARPIAAFMRGYSGLNWPATFAETAVAAAPARGTGAVLNVKTPTWQEWADLANGDWDDHIRTFFESWPVEVFGSLTVNHEPKNDYEAVRPFNMRNPAYVEWAQIWAPIWCQGIARVIEIAAPIIRARSLDVKIGGCLMEYSWNSYVSPRWKLWDWWNYVDPQYHDVTEFQIDIYAQFSGSPPVGDDLVARLQNCMKSARTAGIYWWSILETAISRTERHGGNTELGTYEDQALWWEDYAARLAEIPGGRTVTYFSLPGEPLNSYLEGPGLEVLADLCLNGRRP